MAGIAVDVRHVVRAYDVALLPCIVALARVGNAVSAGVQDAVGPVGAAADAAGDETAVHGPLRLAGLDGREDLEVRVEDSAPTFRRRFRPV